MKIRALFLILVSLMVAALGGRSLAASAESNVIAVDTDGDGQSDGAELAAGADPKNPLSRLAITATAFAPTGFSLLMVGAAGAQLPAAAPAEAGL